MWWQYRCTLWNNPPTNLVNTSSTPPIHLSSLWWKHLCFTQSKFQLSQHVINRNTTLHIRFSGLIYLIIERLLPFTNLSLFTLPLALGNHFSTLLTERLKVQVWPSGSQEGVCVSLPSLMLNNKVLSSTLQSLSIILEISLPSSLLPGLLHDR